MTHQVEIRRTTRPGHPSRPPVVSFEAVCSCGERSGQVPAAGMAHGWEAAHV